MNKPEIHPALTTNRLALVAAVIWIAVLAASLVWNWHQVENSTRTLAEKEAMAYFEKDVAYRHWSSMQGGVYVQPTETTPPNPYLENMPDRDVTTKCSSKGWAASHWASVLPAMVCGLSRPIARHSVSTRFNAFHGGPFPGIFIR